MITQGQGQTKVQSSLIFASSTPLVQALGLSTKAKLQRNVQDKRSSYLPEDKKFYKIDKWDQCCKTFKDVIYEWANYAWVFVLGGTFQSSHQFASRAGTYPKVVPFK